MLSSFLYLCVYTQRHITKHKINLRKIKPERAVFTVLGMQLAGALLVSQFSQSLSRRSEWRAIEKDP